MQIHNNKDTSQMKANVVWYKKKSNRTIALLKIDV